MPAKKKTKAELIEAILDYEEMALKNMVEGFPHQLRTHIKRLMRIQTLTKIELELHHVFQEAPSQRAYRFPLSKITPENVILSEDDPMLPIIKVANEAYGEDLVMNYYKIPNDDFGDTLAKFISSEIKDTFDSGASPQDSLDSAAQHMYRAADQLTSVAHALAEHKIHNPDNLWQKVVFAADCLINEDGTRKCPACGGNYDECPCPGPTQSDLYEYSIEDDVMYARRKDQRPLGEIVVDRVEKTTQEMLSEPTDIFTDKPESPIRKMDSDEDKMAKSIFREMLSDEDRKAESNLILAAEKHKHIVVPADGEPRDRVIWVCTKCWPTTNEVLTLGRGMNLNTHCEICGYKSENDDDLNAIWKSWIARVLRRHWEEHKA